MTEQLGAIRASADAPAADMSALCVEAFAAGPKLLGEEDERELAHAVRRYGQRSGEAEF